MFISTDTLISFLGWKQVKPADVVHLWKSPQDAEDPSETAVVPSDWYEHNGTPTTKCGMDMTYSGTFVFEPVIKKTGV